MTSCENQQYDKGGPGAFGLPDNYSLKHIINVVLLCSLLRFCKAIGTKADCIDSVLDDACTSQFFGENIPIFQWSALNGRGKYETSDHRGSVWGVGGSS